MVKPAIVMMSKFKTPNAKQPSASGWQVINYDKYVNYMDRQDAKEISEYDLEKHTNSRETHWSGNKTLTYLGDPQKTNNTFTKGTPSLSMADIESMKDYFARAQENGSPLWQTVFSFDNAFLKQQGYLSEDGKLNDVPIKHATENAMTVFMEEMGFNDTARWVGAIHYNTDNIHVHVALVEAESSREIIETGKYKGQRKAKAPKGTFKKTRSTFTNTLVDRSQELTRASNLARNQIREPFKQLKLKRQVSVRGQIKELVRQLPDDRRLWRYNMNAMAPFREQIDAITERLVDQKYAAALSELKLLYRQEESFRKRLYGGTNNYAEKQLSTLKASLGNVLLTNLKKEFPKYNPSVKGHGYYHPQKILVKSKLISDLKYSLRETKQDFLNKEKHRQLEYQQGLDISN